MADIPQQDIRTFRDLQAVFDQYLLLADRDIVKIVCANYVANQFKGYPNWLFVVAPSSGGKCFDGKTEVLLYDGSIKQAKDIVVGDLLMGDDSRPRKVLETHQGTDQMYRVSQENGNNYTVNSAHTLTLKYTTTRKEYKQYEPGQVIDIELPDYLNKSDSFKKIFKGIKTGVEFKPRQIPKILEPYFLGLWLGDGRSAGPSISKPDNEIRTYMQKYAKRIGLLFVEHNYNKSCPSFNLVKKVPGKQPPNPLYQVLRDYGLPEGKYIPDDYKLNTREIRLQVLAGLLDTDGYLDGRGRFQFSSKSKKLANDVAFIARSLGFSVNLYQITKSIKSVGFTGSYWAVNIIGDTHLIPTKIKRKQAAPRTYKRGVLSCGIKVNPVGQGKYYGFQVDGNSRFLLSDFTIVHNSAIIQAFNDVNIDGHPLSFPISDITTNAFASGQKKVGKETSLLHRIPPGGLIVFKDFTSMVSKAKEQRTAIFGQLREIYDGDYTKMTGTGENVFWHGKVGALAGATEVIYEYQQEFAAMGDRFIIYGMAQPDRDAVLDFTLDESRINSDKTAMQEHLRAATTSYMSFLFAGIQDDDIHLSEELKNDLKKVANFCTRVRSGLVTDERRPNIINFVPAPEMPIRMIQQLLNLAKALIFMRRMDGGLADGNATLEESKILYKIAFDSIPIKRRMALKALARYEGGVTTKGLAMTINYQTPVVNAWLAQLNALGICTREHKGGNQGDVWKFRKEYREMMVKFEGVEVVNEALMGDDEGPDAELEQLDSYHQEDARKAEQQSLDMNDPFAGSGF